MQVARQQGSALKAGEKHDLAENASTPRFMVHWPFLAEAKLTDALGSSLVKIFEEFWFEC